MSPISGLTEARRIPRLGKIRLGIKVPNASGIGEHPVATDYFVLTPELQKQLGVEKPKELEIMFPIEDETIFAQQWYRRYSNLRGLVCKGDGLSRACMIDTDTGAIASRDSKNVSWADGLECEGRKCPEYQAKNCQEVLNLQFIMPNIPGLGVWQIDTGSVNSIININSAIAFIRGVYKRISFIPLVLALTKQEVIIPADMKKKTVQVLTLNARVTMAELAAAAVKTASVFLIPAPVTSEPPEDATPEEQDEEPQAAEKVSPAAEVIKPEAPQKQAQEPDPNAIDWDAPKRSALPRMATEEQWGRLKDYRDLYALLLKPFIQKQNKSAQAFNELTHDQAEAVIKDVEDTLKTKGVL